MHIAYLGTEERRDYLQGFAGRDTLVHTLAGFQPSIPKPVGIESKWDEYLSVPALFESVEEAHRRNYEAVLTGCFNDPGVDGAREIVPIPIIGPGEASLYTACLLGDRFSIVTILPNTIRPVRHLVHRYGLDYRLASIRCIDTPVLKIREGLSETFEQLLRTARQAVNEDFADVIILGCASLSHVFGERLQQELDEPVINVLRNSLKIAEMLISQKLTHSKRAYPVPPKRQQRKV